MPSYRLDHDKLDAELYRILDAHHHGGMSRLDACAKIAHLFQALESKEWAELQHVIEEA